MNFVWEKCNLKDDQKAEFPTDLIPPSEPGPLVYYWNGDKQIRESNNTNEGWVTIPTYRMSENDISTAKNFMVIDLIKEKRSQAVEVISGIETGLAIFI